MAQAVQQSTLVPSAVDLLWGGGPARLGRCSSKDPTRRSQLSSTQLAPCSAASLRTVRSGTSPAGARGALPGRVSFPPHGLAQTLRLFPEAIARPAVGAAYVSTPVSDEPEGGARRLAERIRDAFDPERTFV